MKATAKGMLRTLATRGVIAAIPVAMVSAYASGIFVQPPRLAALDYVPVAEIVDSPTTVGIADSPLYGQTKAQIDQQLDDMLAIGVTNIRVFVPWGTIEYFGVFDPETYPGNQLWQNIENIMQAAAERNMGVLAEVNGTPNWAMDDPNGGNFPVGSATPDPDAFAAFMQRFITNTVEVNGATVTYGSIVSAYEIWNEPNYIGSSNPVDPEAYAALLKVAYPAIKALDPTATVVVGAVGAGQDSALTMNTVTFVNRMLAALGPNAASYFDALSIHPYGEEIKFGDSCPTCAPGVLTPREQFEAIAAMQQLTGKKIWITEYGLPTTPGGPWTEADQAAWDKNLLDTWNAYADPTSPYYDAQIAALLGPVFLYTGRDTPGANGVNNPQDYYGLWNADGSLKTAGQMLKDWITAHTPTDPTDPTDPGNPGDAIAQFFQKIFQQIGQAIANAFGQQLVTAIVTAISNWLSSLGAPVATTTAAPLTLRVASVEAASEESTLAADSTEPAAAAKIAATVEAATETDPAAATVEVTPVAATTPVVTTPVVTEPVVTTPVVTTPVVTTPVVTTPVVTTPVVTTPVVTTPVVTTPVATKPEAPTTPDTGSTTPSTDKGDPDGSSKSGDAKDGKGDAPKSGDSDKSGKGDAPKSGDSDKSGGDKSGPSSRHSKTKGDNGFGGGDAPSKAGTEAATASAGVQGASTSEGGGSEG